MPNASVENYITRLNYDPRVLFSVVPDGTTSAVPVKDRQPASNGVIICTKIQHKLNKNLDAVAILSPTAGVVFPGALVRADQNLSEGYPTPIALPRGPRRRYRSICRGWPIPARLWFLPIPISRNS